jgi:hypothetical protein
MRLLPTRGEVAFPARQARNDGGFANRPSASAPRGRNGKRRRGLRVPVRPCREDGGGGAVGDQVCFTRRQRRSSFIGRIPISAGDISFTPVASMATLRESAGMNALRTRLPRFSVAWARAFLFGLFACSAFSATYLGIRGFGAERAMIAGLYPSVVAVIFAVPAFLVAWLAPPMKNWMAPLIGALCCALPLLLIERFSDSPQWPSTLRTAGSDALAGAIGGLGFWAFREREQPRRLARFLFWISVTAVLVPIGAWYAAWQIPERLGQHEINHPWETATSGECLLMAKAIREMKMDQLPGQPPLMSTSRTGGACDWPALGIQVQRVTWSEFREAAGPSLADRYIEHIGVVPPRYSLLRLHANVEVSHACGPLCGTGYSCSFRRGLSGWKFLSCRRAWIA